MRLHARVVGYLNQRNGVVEKPIGTQRDGLPSRIEIFDQEDAGDEAADMGPPGDASGAIGQEQARASLHDLHQEPEPGKEQRRDHEEQRDDENRHEHADPGVRKCDSVSRDDAGNGARGAERGNGRGWIEDGMRGAGDDAGQTIEDEKACAAEPFLERGTEDVEGPHVEDDVQEAAVQERVGEKGRDVERAQSDLGGPARMEVAARNESVVDEKSLLGCAAQRQLVKEHGDIDGDDDPDPGGKARRGDVVTDREHAGLFLDTARPARRLAAS